MEGASGVTEAPGAAPENGHRQAVAEIGAAADRLPSLFDHPPAVAIGSVEEARS